MPTKNPSIQHLAGTSKRKNKLPPIGYTCNICKACGDNRHYVTACPSKEKKKIISVPATSTSTTSSSTVTPASSTSTTTSTTLPQKSATNDPAANPCKIFVSGLLFTTTKKDLSDMFGSIEQVVVSNVRLLLFSGSKRCNGMAFVTLTTLEGARKAIDTLHNTSVTDDQGIQRTLSVVPALSRNVTNKKRSNNGNKNRTKNIPAKKKQKKNHDKDHEQDKKGTYIYKDQGRQYVEE
jgi:RNA recognition motif-containing protein